MSPTGSTGLGYGFGLLGESMRVAYESTGVPILEGVSIRERPVSL